MNQIKKINAVFNESTVRVYQAYNKKIADEAINLGRFGSSFKIDRMTWIKPSFLWMMYRSGWGKKTDQERILAIDMKREGFNHILTNVVLSTYEPEIYSSNDEWKEKLNSSQVRCQWDPDRDIYGNPLQRRAIQLGIKGDVVNKYMNEWITAITDITNGVSNWKEEIDNQVFDIGKLPQEKEYLIDESMKKILGMK